MENCDLPAEPFNPMQTTIYLIKIDRKLDNVIAEQIAAAERHVEHEKGDLVTFKALGKKIDNMDRFGKAIGFVSGALGIFIGWFFKKGGTI